MRETFSFDDIKKDWLYIREGRSNPPFAALKRNILNVPGVPGGYLQTTDVEPRIISQPIGFKAVNYEDAQSLKDELVSWLVTEKPKDLIFPDEPNRVYKAVVNNSIDDFERIAWLRHGTIEFLCVDPYAYGEESTHEITGMVPNEGTAPAQPIFDFRVTQETEMISISNLSNMRNDGEARGIYLGTEPDVEEDTEEASTLILHDTMKSTAGWTGATSVDSGIISGTMAADEKGFYVSDWGQEDSDRDAAIKTIDDDINARKNTLLAQIRTNDKEIDRLNERIKIAESDVKTKESQLRALQNALIARKADDQAKLKAGTIKVLPSYTTDENRINTLKKQIESQKAEIKGYQDSVAALKKENDGLYKQLDALGKERNDRVKPILAGSTVWLGPSLKREFPTELNSFIADINVENRNEFDLDGNKINGGVGIIEVYLRDINDNLICKFGFGDSSGAAFNSGTFVASGKRYPIQGASPSSLNDFDGQLRINRDTGYYYPALTWIKGGIRMHWIEGGQIIPNATTPAVNPVKSIQVAIRKAAGAKRIYQRIKAIKVYKTVGQFEYPDKTVVHKFKPGDHIQVDCSKGVMRLNGEERNDLVHLGTDFFTLTEGLNQLETSGNVEGRVSFNARYR